MKDAICKDFLLNLSEGLNSPLNVSWEKTSSTWTGVFSIDSIEYQIFIKNYSSKSHWLFKFTTNHSFELQNDLSKALTVIPTIEKAAEDFITEIKPDAFIFTASDSSLGRKKFYTRFCERISKKHNFLFHTEKSTNQQIFILKTDTCDDIELSTVSLPNMYRDNF